MNKYWRPLRSEGIALTAEERMRAHKRRDIVAGIMAAGTLVAAVSLIVVVVVVPGAALVLAGAVGLLLIAVAWRGLYNIFEERLR